MVATTRAQHAVQMQCRSIERAAQVFANDDLLSLICACALASPGWSRVQLTCKRWRTAADAEKLWRDICHRHFPATARLVGVTSHKAVFAQLHGGKVFTSTGTSQQRPALEEYQFHVRLVAGAVVLLDQVLNGRDAASKPWDPQLPTHRRIVWPVAVSDLAVPARCSQDADRTALVRHLDMLATRHERRDTALEAEGQMPWHVMVDTFRASDQRCGHMMSDGVMDGCRPSECIGSEGWERLEFVSISRKHERSRARNHLDANMLKVEGIVLRTPSGDAWHPDLDPDEEDVEGWENLPPHPESGTCILFKVALSPRIVSPGKVKWLLDLELECEGPPAWYSLQMGVKITAPLEHDLLLRALDGLNVRS